MSKLTKALTAAAGNAGGAGLTVEDVFSTYLYTGTGSTQTITNGIDLDGEGGLVWNKLRAFGSITNSLYQNHWLTDTVRGAGQTALNSNTIDAAGDTAVDNVISSFNSDGFTLSSIGSVASGSTGVSWTFRKAEKFFDVVTYTGNGVAGREIAHNLNSVPACIIVKNISLSGYHWQVYHTSTGNTDYLNLNDADATASFIGAWNNTSPTSTHFTLGNWAQTNDAAGSTYVAYLFASDAGGFGDDGSESIIKCGSYNSSNTVETSVDVGFEPQFIIYKDTSATGEWYIQDVMRGNTATGQAQVLRANNSAAEYTSTLMPYPTSTGFNVPAGWGAGNTYIYIAIRRPMKTPESGTEVFAIGQGDGDADVPDYISNFPVDAAITKRTSAGNNGRMSSRLTGANYLSPNLTQAESADDAATFDFMNGWGSDGTSRNTDEYSWMFKRATGFFDVVAYTGTGVSRTVAHNLGVVPELMIVKTRNAINHWNVYHVSLGNTKYIRLNSTNGSAINDSWWDNTSPTDSVFTVFNNSGVNASGSTYIAYLFATLAGVSKVGSYTGNGASQTIDCGFSGGARFILIKRTDSTGDWYVWDTERGIVAGNDPHLSLNTTAAEVTTDDSIDPDSSGFIVNQVAATNINVSSASYIYLSIA